jgi:hypothetical protein
MAKLTAHQIRAIAVASFSDPRTVRRFLAGAAVSSTCRERIAHALCEAGLAPSQAACVGAEPANDGVSS